MTIEDARAVFRLYDRLKADAASMPPDVFARYASQACGALAAPGMGVMLVAMLQVLMGRCDDAEEEDVSGGV